MQAPGSCYRRGMEDSAAPVEGTLRVLVCQGKGKGGGMIVGFAGLTHLGWIMMAAAAKKGHQVVGYDPSPEERPVWEPDLLATMQNHQDHIRERVGLYDLAKCDLVFVTLDVPVDENGHGNLAPIDLLLGAVLDKCGGPVVLMSQVPPGYTRKWKRHDLYYQMEPLIFGKSMDRALNPEMHIIGCESLELGVSEVVLKFLSPVPTIITTYESAELAKMAVNAFLASSVSLANMLSRIAKSVGADYEAVKQAMQSDARIGRLSYLKPGSWSASKHLRRDVMALKDLSHSPLLEAYEASE